MKAFDIIERDVTASNVCAAIHKYRRIRIREKTFLATLFVLTSVLVPLEAADSGASVVVVYNSKMAESKQVAQYYAQRRQVPTNQIFGFELPVEEQMSRPQFLDQLQSPLLQKLEENRLFTFNPPAKSQGTPRHLVNSTIRYLVLCYGGPTKITRDPALV